MAVCSTNYLIFLLLVTFVGITIILFHQLIKTTGFKDEYILFYNSNNSPMVLKLAYLSLFGVTYILIKFIEDVYREKSWYDPKFWPPATYIRG
jgi:hypothetical protein